MATYLSPLFIGCLALGVLADECNVDSDECRQEITQFVKDNPTELVQEGDNLFLLQTDAKAFVFATSEVDTRKNSAVSGAAPWSFYHITVIPLLLVTAVVAYFSRPQLDTRDEMTPKQFESQEFKAFENRYLLVWGFAVAADWLQGPYVYALYDSFGYTREDINVLFLVGFVSSMLFGTFVGSLADAWGRKRAALLYCVLYIVSCLTKHCSLFPCLVFGRITGGIATSILFSTFESWLVAEHRERFHFSDALLRYMFSMMYFVNYLVAIVSGLFANAFVAALPMRRFEGYQNLHYGGNLCPFDLAVLMLILVFPLICFSWPENYGEPSATRTTAESFGLAIKTLGSSWQILGAGVIVAFFEGGMYAFVINWTPALEMENAPIPPFGIIFSTMMMSCMFGASIFSFLKPESKPVNTLFLTCGLAFLCFLAISLCVGVPSLVSAVYFSFLAFEMCVGLYMPSCSALKSDLVPEESRATIYGFYRVPLNIVVCCIVLPSLSLKAAFGTCAMLMALAVVVLGAMRIQNNSKKGSASPSLTPRCSESN